MTIKKNKKKRLILLDSHAILHRAYHALPDFKSNTGEPTGALYGLSTMLLKTIKDLKPDYIVACFDRAEDTFRKEVFEEYKAGRVKTDDELISQLERARDFFQSFGIPVYDKAGYEADDLIGTIVEKTKKDKDLEVIISSGDMDTLQLVSGDKVRVFTLRKGITDTILYDEDAVKERFGFGPELLPDFKGLRGDPSDNIPGITGIGEKTATELMVKFGGIKEIYKAVKKGEDYFKEQGLKPRVFNLLKEGEEEAIFSKELGTIKLDVPIDFNLGKTFEENFDIKKADKMFSDLGFTALRSRLANELNSGESVREESSTSLTEDEMTEAKLALWLLDSSKTNPTEEDVLNYSSSIDLKEAREIILSDLKKEGLDKVLNDIELPLVPIIKKMEDRGVLVDKIYLQELSKKYHKELERFEKTIWEEAGEEFNINSPKQMGEILFDKMEIRSKNVRLKKTSTGAVSTNAAQLEKLRGEHKIIDQILKYREYQKLLSTYIDNIPEMLDKDNRLHAKFVQTGTTTGRLSSKDPNLQNIPIRSELGKAIRNAFVATPGHKLVALDYSQIDLRAAALLSGDEKLLKAFNSGEDVHTAVASEVFEVSPDKVDKEMRRRAKIINFGIIYGMGVTALQQNLETTRAEAQEFHNIYFEKFKRLAKYLEETKQFALKNGYTETFFGRRRYFPAIDSRVPFIKAAAERQASNAPIQGTASDIIKIATIKADKEIGKEAHLLLQIHDELIYEIEDKKVEEVSKKIKEIMESIIKEPVEFIVTTKLGDNWGEI